MTAGHYSVHVRMLSCEHCGAPLEAPIEGGHVQCGYCNAAHVVQSRSLLPIAGHDARELSEQQRLATLRAQRGEIQAHPAELRHLLRRGKLDPSRVDEALKRFHSSRATAQERGDEASERLLFSLALLLANHYGAAQDHARARAILESAVETLRTPRYRQSTYGMLARLAARVGEHESAAAWTQMLDSRSTDLPTDTAYRLTHGFILSYQGQHAGVLDLLGSNGDEVPIDAMSRELCTLLRCHALESTQGVDVAAGELARSARGLGAWIRLDRGRRTHAASGLELCPASFARAKQQVSPLKRSWLTVPVAASAIFLAVGIPLALSTAAYFGGDETRLGLAAPISLAVVSAWAIPRLVRIFRAWAPV
jgi:hypothetical protein